MPNDYPQEIKEELAEIGIKSYQDNEDLALLFPVIDEKSIEWERCD